MGKKKSNKQKRGSLLAAGLLSFGLAALALVIGFYVGITTLNVSYGINIGGYGVANNVNMVSEYDGIANGYGSFGNYYTDGGTFANNTGVNGLGYAHTVGSTIGTIGSSANGAVYLFICAGLMIALGSIGVSIGFKLLSLSKSTNFSFYTKKGMVISSLVFYGIITIVGIASIVFGFVAMSGTALAGSTLMLSGIAIAISVLCFILVLKEYKKFMTKIKMGEVVIEIEYPKRYVPASQSGNMAYAAHKYSGTGVDIESFQRELVRLDEMRGKGLINDQEYQQLKQHWISRMNNKIF